MSAPTPGRKRWTRRAFSSTLPAFALPLQASDRGREWPAEARRYLDPATEFPVELLTSPEYTSVLPPSHARSIARRGAFFLFASDRGSGLQAFRFELRSGTLKQLTDARRLRPETINLLPGDRAFCYFDGDTLNIAPVSGSRDREVYRIPDGWEFGGSIGVSIDGLYAAVVEKHGPTHRLLLVSLRNGSYSVLAEIDGVIRNPIPRPKRASVLYQRDDSIWLVNYDGEYNQRICPRPAWSGAALWDPGGRSVLYLAEDNRRVTLRECLPDSRTDQVVAPTSQYAGFSPNPDGSAFVACSGSLASPYILVLVRSVKRELTLCEHKASNPLMVSPVFSPTSQRIYFQSDRHGKPAIHSVVVDKFIEKTEDEEDRKDQETR